LGVLGLCAELELSWVRDEEALAFEPMVGPPKAPRTQHAHRNFKGDVTLSVRKDGFDKVRFLGGRSFVFEKTQDVLEDVGCPAAGRGLRQAPLKQRTIVCFDLSPVRVSGARPSHDLSQQLLAPR